MQVELRNIGPVNRAAIDLDGLAVLVGPNGSGKTTLSTACYAAVRARVAADLAVRRLARNHALGVPKVDISLTEDFLGNQFATSFRDALAKELARCYSPELSKVPRRGRAGNGSAPRIVVSESPHDSDSAWRITFRIHDDAVRLEPAYSGYRLPRFVQLVAEVNAGEVPTLFGPRFSPPDTPVYFPAGRSGYVQMQSVVSSLLMSTLGRGDYQLSVGKISGIAADFLQFLAAIDPSRLTRAHTRVADRLENDLLGGHLRLVAAGDVARVMEFAPHGLAEYWPMDAAATSVAEIAPLLLYLRHRARRGDRLFIDEPEAHLHPANQLVLADILVELVSLCAGMVVGTHSGLFIQGICNSYLRRETGPGRNPSVVLYELAPASSTGGYESTRTEIDRVAGVDVNQFSSISEAALDEADELFERAHRGD